MTFIRGEKCNLTVLQESEYEAYVWTQAVMGHETTEYLFTGSYPLRFIDILGVWKKERESGDILFGVWTTGEDPRFIGTCGLHSHRSIYRSFEARWLIFDKDWVGKGTGQEAVKLLTHYAFTYLNAHRVWLGVNEENLRAYKCYLNVGYKVEGTLRDEIWCNGRYVNAVRMGLLEDEWKSPSSAKAE